MDETNNITFESYFSGNMSAKEVLDFESALDSNPELSKEYELFLSIKKSTSDIHRDRLRNQLDTVLAANNSSDSEISISEDKAPSKNTSKIIRLIKMASAVACLFLIGFWVLNMNAPQDNEAIFAEYFEEYTPQFSRGTDMPTSTEDKSDLETPEQKLIYANDVLSQSSEDSEYKEAIEVLTEITDVSMLRDQKYWYLGLANLKIGNIEEAQKHLTYLQSISNFKKQEIEKILSTIK